MIRLAIVGREVIGPEEPVCDPRYTWPFGRFRFNGWVFDPAYYFTYGGSRYFWFRFLGVRDQGLQGTIPNIRISISSVVG